MILIKVFWTFEQKEHWFDEMSAKGFHLRKSRSFCRYEFGENSGSHYRYNLNCTKSDTPRAERFRKLLEESGWNRLQKFFLNSEFDIYVRENSDNRHDDRCRKEHFASLLRAFSFRLLGAILGFCSSLLCEHAISQNPETYASAMGFLAFSVVVLWLLPISHILTNIFLAFLRLKMVD